MSTDREVDVTTLSTAGYDSEEPWAEPLADAIDLASDQDQMTWLIRDGQRIAAIVPVNQAEFAEHGRVVASAAARELMRLAEQAVASCNLVNRETGDDSLRVTRVRQPKTERKGQ